MTSDPRIKDRPDGALLLFKGLDYSDPKTQTALNRWNWDGYYPVVVDGRVEAIAAADDARYAISDNEEYMTPRLNTAR